MAEAAPGALDERLTAAHRALREGGEVQFILPPATPPAPPPAWLKALGEWLQWALSPIGRLIRWISGLMPEAPYARIALWAMITALAVLVAWMIWTRVRSGEWRLPRRRRATALATDDTETPADWAPDAAPARRWLDEADRLAAEGRYGEAIHHILLRSVEDIASRRPRLVRPALTSRDIARADAIPDAPRGLFAGLAAVVERSLFGGAPVDADDWGRCRAAYTEFALPQAWRG
ncbi:DUF4129 domain-containing protein [Sphingomonas radiodurans]|uniref:DUF4129 domain-containing protein n=1 Tax=Sphingomonas radiodurans TaxID=2890321 RepID=UPI001E454438|nr:DUF4129 domain-containing protein [Sphingomonas radiodurans]WBH18165.1 DUF4129 domain-containing protein [Sphingomonas radiodurans]